MPTKAELEAEIVRLREVVERLTTESVDKAPMQFVEGGIEIEHWAVRLLVGSFRRSIGDAENYVEITAFDTDGNKFVATVMRSTGKTPHQLRREAEEKLAAERERCARIAAGWADTKAGKDIAERIRRSDSE